jgi:hypothetical protein
MAQTALASLRTYADLTKPRLLPMVLFTGLPLFGMAGSAWRLGARHPDSRR